MTLLERIENLKCCNVNSVWQSSHDNLLGLNCNPEKTILFNAKFQILKQYIPEGTVTITNVIASADIDLSSVLNLGVISGTLTVNLGSSTITISVFSGNYATLSDLIDGIIAGMIGGWTGVNSDPILTVTAPTNLGINPISDTVSLTFSPYFVWINEVDNSLNNHSLIGYTIATSAGLPSFVPASESFYLNDLLYVPNRDSARAFRIDRNFTGVIVGDDIVGEFLLEAGGAVALGMSTFIFAVGTKFQLNGTGLGAGIALNCTINGGGYNIGAGTFDFHVDYVSAAPPNAVVQWTLNVNAPFNSFSTINVYDVVYTPGTIVPPVADSISLTLNPSSPIECPASQSAITYYDNDPAVNAVYCFCQATDSINTWALVRIDMTSPFIVTAAPPPCFLGSGAGFTMAFNTVKNMFYLIDGVFSTLRKVDTSLQHLFATTNLGGYNALTNTPAILNGVGVLGQYYTATVAGNAYPPVNVTIVGQTVVYNGATWQVEGGFPVYCFSVDTISGNMYHARGETGNILDANINLLTCSNLYDVADTTSIFFILSDYMAGAAPQMRSVQAMYFNPVNSYLFLIRANTLGAYFLQSYNLLAGSAAAINASRVTYTFPNSDVSGGGISFQPGINKLFLSGSGNDTTYIFDPNTFLFDASFVDLRPHNDAKNFTPNCDQVNFNYFGEGGNNWITVEHAVVPTQSLDGVFIGTVTEYVRTAEENCQTEQQIEDAVEEFTEYCGGCGDCATDITDINSSGGGTLVGILYYGKSANTSLTDVQVQALNAISKPNFAGSYSFPILIDTYDYVYYPASWGVPTSIIDQSGFPFAVLTPYLSVTILGQAYTGIRSFNQLGGASTMTLNQ